MFLLEDASDAKFAGLLTDGSMSNVFGDETSSKPMNSDAPVSNPFNTNTNTNGSNTSVGSPPVVPVAATRKNVVPALRPSSIIRPGSRTTTPPPPPVTNTNTNTNTKPTPVIAVTRPPPQMTSKFNVSIEKSTHGIGLDISKNQTTGGTSITRLKELPIGITNPAAICIPKLLAGDNIIAVNNITCLTFSACVKCIRASEGIVTLTIERN